jgi:hypothetical protein
MESYREESALPPFIVSDENKARMIAIGVQENIPFDHALAIVLDYYMSLKKEIGCDLDDLHSVLQLAIELGERGISVKDVKAAMRFRQVFREGDYTSEDFQAALDLLPLLHEHGLGSQDDRAERALGLAARLLNSSRSLPEIETWLTSPRETYSVTEEAQDPSSEQKQD